MKLRTVGTDVIATSLLLFILTSCGPSQAQLNAQSTQAAQVIYSTQTQAAADQYSTQAAAIPTWTATVTRTNTPTHTPSPTYTPTSTRSIPGVYHSQVYPFSIEYPAEWIRLPNQTGITRAYGDLNTGVGIYIAEEDLILLGLSDANLQQYVDIIMFILSSTEGFKLIADEQIINAHGLPVEILDFRIGPEGSLHGRRLIYVHENKIGFNASYLAFEENFLLLEPTIQASFDSFQITE